MEKKFGKINKNELLVEETFLNVTREIVRQYLPSPHGPFWDNLGIASFLRKQQIWNWNLLYSTTLQYYGAIFITPHFQLHHEMNSVKRRSFILHQKDIVFHRSDGIVLLPVSALYPSVIESYQGRIFIFIKTNCFSFSEAFLIKIKWIRV